MSIFQISVLNKYLKNLDEVKLKKARQQFDEFYGDKLRLLNIMRLKEENYQEGFLREIFVDVLGYTINPNTDYNLTTEFKNQTGAKKADGAILKNGKASGVIELKSTKTKDLDKVTEQAFNYKNNQPGCRYVITSNFQKLRFYIDNATEYEEFNLFNLTETDFKILYLLLNKDALLNDLPAKLKEETKFHEEDISKQFYKDYQKFKHAIFNNLVKNNPNYDKLILFKKSQKLLDRFLFIFFAEDTGLVPPNAVSKIIEQWNMFKENDEYFPLYSRFQKFFTHLNSGYTYKVWGEIPAYNGGLFAIDEILDNPDLKIDDEILKDDSLHMSAYDFNTDVDVNILGHIFEHSLNEIEEMESTLSEASSPDSGSKKTSKRKKDGVFYTPKYITKYIVENTIGTLCNEKKQELALLEFDATDGYRKADGKLTAKAKKLFDTLETYRKWLLTLKVLDPACGSGAFLNQALSFFMEEHNWIAERQQEITGDASSIFTDTDKAVLENNIYGVDINEESVEIAKLSLWLRTAQKGRTLSDLSGNIKCGNSLIDDPEVAGEKAFDWNTEFKEIMDKGGFDVVIGNPPYVDMRSIKAEHIKYFKKQFFTASNRVNLFGLFVEKAYSLMKIRSEFGMIIHRNLIRSNEYEKCRELILAKTEINSILSFKNGVFEGVTGEMTVLTFSRKNVINSKKLIDIYNYEINIDSGVSKSLINQNDFNRCLGKRFNVYLTEKKSAVIDKILNDYIHLKDIGFTLQGIIAGDEKKFISTIKRDDNYKPIVRGRNIKRYSYFKPFEYIYYIEGTKVLTRSRKRENFEYDCKILTQHVSGGINAYLDREKLYYMQTINGTIVTDSNYSTEYIVSLLNSRLINFYYDNIFNIGAEFTTAVAIENLDLIPIKIIPRFEQEPFIERVNEILDYNKILYEKSERFIKRIQSNLDIEKISGKLQNFYEYDFKTFLAELKKQKITLSLSQQDEWEEYFDTYKQEINQLQNQINQTDNEIDQMVYELYDLTEEEIKIVENS
jgi:hypothetical protein